MQVHSLTIVVDIVFLKIWILFKENILILLWIIFLTINRGSPNIVIQVIVGTKWNHPWYGVTEIEVVNPNSQ
jgi:hypothetical protein